MSYKLLGLLPALVVFIWVHIIWWRSRKKYWFSQSTLEARARIISMMVWGIIIIVGVIWAFS